MDFALAAFQAMRDWIAGVGVSLRAGQLPRVPQWIFFLTGALIPAVILFQLLRMRRRSLFEQLVEHLDRLGYRVEASSTGGEILGSLQWQNPSIAAMVAPVVRCHEVERFSGHEPSDELKAAARAALRKLREA